MASTGLNSGPGVVGNPSLAGGLLLSFVLLGLAVFIWVFWSQRGRLKVFQKDISCCGQQASFDGLQNIHKGLLALLLLDAVHAIMGLVLGVRFLTFPYDLSVTYATIFLVWFMSRGCTQALHLLVALGSIAHLYLPLPQSTARMTLTAIWMVVVFVAMVLCYVFVSRFFILGIMCVIFSMAFTIIAKSARSAPTPSATARKKPFLLLSMFTFLVIFMPAFVLQCIVFYSPASHDYIAAFTYTLFFTNFQLWADALLTYFVFKLPTEQEEPQRHPGLQAPGHAVTVNVVA